MNRIRKTIFFRKKGQEGFSLVEAVVATFLLTVGLMSAASVMISVTGHQKIADILTSATNLAEAEMESLRHLRYTEILDSTEDFGEISEYDSYKREVVVTPNAEDTLKTVEVTVRHLGGQQVKLQTMITR